MNKFLFVILISSSFGCIQQNQSHELETDPSLEISVPPKKDSTILPLKDTTVHKQALRLCNCTSKAPKMSRRPDLTFSSYKFTLDSLEKWQSEKALKIKHLALNKFDSIPSALGLFKNVEFLTIGQIDWSQITGFNIFPKLKGIHLRGKAIDLSKNPKWLQKIEIIRAEKSKIIGLKSFKSLPKLKKMTLAFSGFDVFPSDFENLHCLNYFQTGAHTHGKIDLTKIDLSKMPCLEYVEFHSWHKNLDGLPLGLQTVKNIKIHHGNLSKEEKQQLRKYVF